MAANPCNLDWVPSPYNLDWVPSPYNLDWVPSPYHQWNLLWSYLQSLLVVKGEWKWSQFCNELSLVCFVLSPDKKGVKKWQINCRFLCIPHTTFLSFICVFLYHFWLHLCLLVSFLTSSVSSLSSFVSSCIIMYSLVTFLLQQQNAVLPRLQTKTIHMKMTCCHLHTHRRDKALTRI